MYRIPTHTFCNIVLSMCAVMCMCIHYNMYVAPVVGELRH